MQHIDIYTDFYLKSFVLVYWNILKTTFHIGILEYVGDSDDPLPPQISLSALIIVKPWTYLHQISWTRCYFYLFFCYYEDTWSLTCFVLGAQYLVILMCAVICICASNIRSCIMHLDLNPKGVWPKLENPFTFISICACQRSQSKIVVINTQLAPSFQQYQLLLHWEGVGLFLWGA